MNFTADSYYLIGKGHMYCQDYSYSGIIDNKFPYVIIADGCSSAKDTDVGARILVNNFIRGLKCDLYWYNLPKYNDSIFKEDAFSCDRLWLGLKNYYLDLSDFFDKNCFTSTLRSSFIFNEKLYLFHYGDGYSIIKDLDTNQIIKKIFTKFQSNAPYYLIYQFVQDYHIKYLAEFSGFSIETENGIFNVEDYLNNESNFFQVIDLKDLPDNFSVSLMSDGIDSFPEDKDFLNEITTYKNYSGEFVKRKLKRFVYDTSKEGLYHSDDLSLATIVKRV